MGLFPSRASSPRWHRRHFLSLFCTALLLPGCALVVREVKEGYIRVGSAISSSEIAITLQDSFIKIYRNRATIETMYAVDRADRRPHPAYWDGDFHVAGRASNIGLPIVAEIMNAAFEADALDLIHTAAATGTPVRLTGAWRLWMEHVGRNEELQGEAVPIHGLTDPDHVFEIHPVTLVGDRNLRESFHPVAATGRKKRMTSSGVSRKLIAGSSGEALRRRSRHAKGYTTTSSFSWVSGKSRNRSSKTEGS